MGTPAPLPPRARLVKLRDESVKVLHASELAILRSFNRARLVATLSAGLLLVGFLLVAQMRGQATLAGSLERQSDQDLAFIIQELTAENSMLRREVSLLQMRLHDADRATEDRTRLLNDAAKELNVVQAVAGLEPATGPGIIVAIADPERVLLPQDMVRLVHELRAGGAEALAVDGVRVAATSGFGMVDGRIELDGTPLAREFEVVAVGESNNLSQALSLPGGLQSTLVTFPGVTLTVRAMDMVTVPAATGHEFVIGTPVKDGS